MVDWNLLCDGLLSADKRLTETRIRIQIGSGLTVEGLIDIEAARTIFRDPETGDVVTNWTPEQPLSLVLPAGTIRDVQFPHRP